MAENTTPKPQGEHDSPADAQEIVQGTPKEIVETLIAKRVGVGVLAPEDVAEVEKALAEAGYDTAGDPPGTSTMSARDRENPGTIHRHGNGGIIVHQTSEGQGTANFYWPVQDTTAAGHYYFDPQTDEVLARATGIKVDPKVVVVFPTSTWHQFGVDANSRRRSSFRVFYPHQEEQSQPN